jgi:hypothetical protein
MMCCKALCGIQIFAAKRQIDLLPKSSYGTIASSYFKACFMQTPEESGASLSQQ